MWPSIAACHAASRLGRVVDKAIEESDLTPAGYRLLGHLATGGETAATVLAEKLLVSRPTVTATVDLLEARGMVVRTPDPNDGRRVRIAETPNGARVDGARKSVADRLAEVLAQLDPGAADDVAVALEQLHDALTSDKLRRHRLDMNPDA